MNKVRNLLLKAGKHLSSKRYILCGNTFQKDINKLDQVFPIQAIQKKLEDRCDWPRKIKMWT